MNYKWKTEIEYGQYDYGFVDVFQTEINNNKAYAIINYLPQFEDKDQKVLTTLILESNKNNWSKGTVKDILYDCEERIKNIANLKFRVFNRLDYMTIQTFYVQNIENFEFGTNGDFSFI